MAIVILAGLSFGEGGTTIAQEKNKYEKQNERKNKSNRRLNRRGDKGKSNKAKIRATKFKSRTKQGEKSYKGDITGRKVVTKTSSRRSSAGRAQPNPYAGRKRKTERSVAKSAKSRPRYTNRRSESAKRVSVNPRFSSGNRERAWKGSSSGRAIKTRSRSITFTGKSNYQGGSFRSISKPSERTVKSGGVRPRSASGNYNVRKRKKPYSFRQKKAWEKAFKGDITGRTFRTKRTNERPVIQSPSQARYSNSGKRGDRPYSGGLSGGFKTAAKKSERAWKRDISGNKLRIRTSSKPTFSGSQFQPYPQKRSRNGDRAYRGKIKSGNYSSVSSRKEMAGRKSLRSEPPGQGTAKGFRFQGNIKTQKPLKGGGSISGGLKNNQGKAIRGKGISSQDIRAAKFLGNIKSSRPLKGGGSISGRLKNNSGKAIQRKEITKQDIRTSKFLGNIKSSRPLKGGGSISGRLKNNNGRAIQRKEVTQQDIRTGKYLGNIKAQRPLKGGGSVSRNNWNNRGQATTKLSNNEQNRRTRRFQGNLKLVKQAKGGGSVNIHPWNNKGNTVNQPQQSLTGRKAANFQGNAKPFIRGKYDALSSSYKGDQKRRFNYQSHPNADKKALKVRVTKNKDNSTEFEGNVKPFVRGKYDALASFYKGNDKRKYDYRKNPNAAKESLKVKQSLKNDRLSANFQGKTKDRINRHHNPASADDALKVKKPGKNYFEGGDFQGRTKVTWNYKQNPSAAKESLKNRPASKATAKGSEFQGRTKVTWNYKQNPHAAKESLKNLPPSQATAKGNKFEGRTKVTWNYKQNPHAAKESLKNLPPSKATAKGSQFQGRYKMANYSRKPNAAAGSLKGIGPSRAAISASNYQGNIKMNKSRINDRHPSYRYARTSTVKDKEKLFGIKLLFSKLFKKNEGQPDNLKEKIRKPRFDKREKDIWYD